MLITHERYSVHAIRASPYRSCTKNHNLPPSGILLLCRTCIVLRTLISNACFIERTVSNARLRDLGKIVLL